MQTENTLHAVTVWCLKRCPLFQWLCHPYLTLGVPIRVKGGAEGEKEEEKSELLVRFLVLREAAAKQVREVSC